MKDMMRSIGLMSGTSMDGIDAAIIETDGDQVKRLKLSVFHPYDKEFKSLVKAAKYCFDKCGGSLKQARSQFSIKAYFKKLKMLDTTIETELPTLENYISDKMAFCAGPTTLDRIIQYSTHLHGLAVLALLEQSGFKQCDINVVGFHGQTMYHNPPEKISVIVGDGQALADQTGILVVNNFRARDVAAGGQGAPFAPLYHEALV
ncbi:MAG: anhydro-N-acetylmuramic acid kinase, partial [Gammaproteobacteria bacterium]